MVTLRDKLCALTLMATMTMLTIGTPVVASMHESCVMDHHDCGASALVVSCDCGHEGERSTQATVEGRVQFAPDWFATSVTLPIASHVLPSATTVAVDGSPPRGSPPDFPTLYASLLI